MTTIVFPGQGSQYLEMSKDFYDNFQTVRDIFELIEDRTKINIRDVIFANPSNLLNQTQYTQLAIFCASISIFKALFKETYIQNLDIKCMLGHSLGEYTALTAAELISIEDCAFLLKKRGEFMQDAYKPNLSGMAAIIGMNCSEVETVIKNNDLNIEIANDNSPMQIVISGIKKDLLNSEKYLKNSGAKKFVLLNVSAAFHSHLMKNAELKMKNFISNTKFNNSVIPIISNYSAKISTNSDDIITNLSLQMSNRVRWVESIKTLEKIKETKIIEIGPGKVLTGLIKRISNNFDLMNFENISDIEKNKNAF